MSTVLQSGDVVRAATLIRATPEQVYAVVSDIRRIPEWSPECIRTEWIAADEFRGMNRRRFGRWSTHAKIVTARPGRLFEFAVQLRGSDFTRWSYGMETAAEGCRLIEEMRMCVDLPFAALAFERIALRVKDRRTDLQGNIDQSLQRLRQIIEAEYTPQGPEINP
ncbi:SRPBCC family protein [Mycolicibacterium sp. P9-22]|uniref:SRPBCC family protein n=1 Tax=Mycolicibacterium sp. P9-22 TaxID=2024613 RepID=UPI0011ECAB3E|nr:SRPBCC family protein [Mycolicibacterium sp. P9-22]KAA0120589.1 SRPBCC family protein [Mycolicibacterium sp. P9-22]